jgi:hypothetical protein
MSSIDTLSFLERISIATKNNKIKWARLSNFFNIIENSNPGLKLYVLNRERGSYFYKKDNKFFYLSQNNSFSTQIEGGCVYLFEYTKYSSKYYVLAVQSNPNAGIKELNSQNEYQTILLELKYNIEQSADNQEEFMKIVMEKLHGID